MSFKVLSAVLLVTIIAYTTAQETSTPVPILKSINRVNDDGSYTYGFEAADGTFKIETRDANGNVKGKYGYLDETGQLKTVEYAAGKPGFEAKGDHLPEQPVAALPVAPEEDPVPVRPVPARLPARTQPVAQPVQQPAFTGSLATPSVQLPSFGQQQFTPQQPQFAPQPQTSHLPFAPPASFNQQPQFAPAQQFNSIETSNGPSRGFSFGFNAPVFAPQQQLTNFNQFQQPIPFPGQNFRAF